MEIPIQLKHVARLLLLITFLAEGTNQISDNLRRLDKPKVAVVSKPVQPTLALKTEPQPKWKPLPTGTSGVLDLIADQDFTPYFEGVGALASGDYINDYLRRQTLPSIWQKGFVYVAEPGPSVNGLRESAGVASWARVDFDAFALADNFMQDPGAWGSPGGSWSGSQSSNNSGGSGGASSGSGASGSGGGGSPQGGAPSAAALGGKNTPATALNNGVSHAQFGSGPPPTALPNMFTMQTAAVAAMGGLNYSFSANNNAGGSLPGWTFANSPPTSGFIFDARAMFVGRAAPQLWATATPAGPTMWDQRLDRNELLLQGTATEDDDPLSAVFPDSISSSDSTGPVPSDAPAVAPEPASWLLVIPGLAGIAISRKRKALSSFLQRDSRSNS